MFITFTEDTYLDPQDGQPAYKAGYVVDVAPPVAQQWIGQGKAVEGKLGIVRAQPLPEPEPEVVEAEPQPEEKPRAKRNWRMDPAGQ